MNPINYFKLLVQNGSGVSSKSFFLVVVTIIGCILLLVPAIILVVEVFFNHTVATDLNGLAAYITAVAAMFASVGITKVWGEKNEHKSHKHHENPDQEVLE